MKFDMQWEETLTTTLQKKPPLNLHTGCLFKVFSMDKMHDSDIFKSYHSDFAVFASCGNRYPSNVLTARASKVLSSDNLKHLDLMSPTAGPPEYVL